jgi:hypothetical protein
VAYPFCPSWAAVGEQVTAGYAAFFFFLYGTRLSVIALSARSGETEDTFISHLAVAFNAGELKVGSIVRGERTAKWNEVLRIERILGDRARFASGSPCDRLRGSPDKAGPSRPLKA